MRGTAIFNDDHTERYSLTRVWDEISSPSLMAVFGINPSKADAIVNDPTIRRVCSFGKRYGHTGIVMLNPYPRIETDSRKLEHHDSARNATEVEFWMRSVTVGRVVIAWGAHRLMADRQAAVCFALWGMRDEDLWCWGRTKGGYPKHPLYLPNSAELQVFSPGFREQLKKRS
jgi:hypothetical protein